MRAVPLAALGALLLAAVPAPPAAAEELICMWDEAGTYGVCVHTWSDEVFQRCWSADVLVHAAGVTHEEEACTVWFHPCEWGCPIKVEDLPDLP